MKLSLLIGLTLAAASVPALAQTPLAPTYKIAQTVTVGGEGGWDLLSADHAAGRLYVSHSGQVEVLDLKTLKSVGTIPNTPRAHDILVVPAHKRGFVSCGESNSVLLFDPVTLAVTGTVATGEGPDVLLYDAYSGRVFVFNSDGHSATVLNAATAKVLGTVALGGAPEFGATDGAGTIFVNLEDKSEVVAFDSKTLKVKHHWPLAPGEEPTGLAYDKEQHRLFSACGNKLVVALDARTGKVLGTAPSGSGTDGLAFDAARHRLFTPNGGDGTLSVFRTDAADGKLPLVETVPTAKGARTVVLDPVSHHLYLPAADYGPAPAPTKEAPKPRRSIVPGSFRMLDAAPAR